MRNAARAAAPLPARCTSLIRMTVQQQVTLLEGINGRSLPSFSSLGVRIVERGAVPG